METNTLGELTRLAGDYAPFFFAVLFLTIVTRVAQGFYYRACSRTNPVASVIEQKTYRLYFLAVTFSSIVLVLLAIGWFVYNQTRGAHVFQIAITELEPTTRIESRYFSRESLRKAFDNSAVSDHFLLIVQDQPFTSGARFPLTVWLLPQVEGSGGALLCGAGPIRGKKQVEIPYRGKAKETFTLRVKGDELELVAVDTPATASFFSSAEIRLAQATAASATRTTGEALR